MTTPRELADRLELELMRFGSSSSVAAEAARFLRTLADQQKQNAKDAERYRWLRDHDMTDLYCSWVDDALNDPATAAEQFDEAIDAARGQIGAEDMSDLTKLAEPVAWRYRYCPTCMWMFADASAGSWTSDHSGYEEQPLYAAPANLAAELAEVKKALAQAEQRVNELVKHLTADTEESEALRARLAQVEGELAETQARASKIAIEAIGAAAKMKAAEAERLAANIRSCALGRTTRGIDGMIRDELLRLAERVKTNAWEQ